MNLLREALTYLDMGWCVYPAHSINDGVCSCGKSDCPCPGKHPIGRWLDFQNRRPTESEVTLWFSSMDCNIGTVTGMVSGIVVVDVDGELGLETINKLRPAPTLTARTGGGGYHLFYSTKERVPSRVKALPGVDLRGDGGYVVLPPSLHRSGRFYEWLDPRKLAEFDRRPFEKVLSNDRSIEFGWHNELFQGVSEGNRSISAARLSGRYFNMGLSFEEAWILMRAWNSRNNPPLEETDLRRTVMAIHRKHETESRPVQVRTFKDIQSLLRGATSRND